MKRVTLYSNQISCETNRFLYPNYDNQWRQRHHRKCRVRVGAHSGGARCSLVQATRQKSSPCRDQAQRPLMAFTEARAVSRCALRCITSSSKEKISPCYARAWFGRSLRSTISRIITVCPNIIIAFTSQRSACSALRGPTVGHKCKISVHLGKIPSRVQTFALLQLPLVEVDNAVTVYYFYTAPYALTECRNSIRTKILRLRLQCGHERN